MPVSGHEPHPNELGFRAVRSGPFGCFRALRVVKIGCRNKTFGHVAHGVAPCRTASQIWHAMCDDVWISHGGVLVEDGAIIGEGCNRPIALYDPGAYAEMIAMRDAAARHQVLRHPGAVHDCASVIVHAFCAWCSVRAISRRGGDAVKNAFWLSISFTQNVKYI